MDQDSAKTIPLNKPDKTKLIGHVNLNSKAGKDFRYESGKQIKESGQGRDFQAILNSERIRQAN